MRSSGVLPIEDVSMMHRIDKAVGMLSLCRSQISR